jgi:hypothetical protein
MKTFFLTYTPYPFDRISQILLAAPYRFPHLTLHLEKLSSHQFDGLEDHMRQPRIGVHELLLFWQQVSKYRRSPLLLFAYTLLQQV